MKCHVLWIVRRLFSLVAVFTSKLQQSVSHLLPILNHAQTQERVLLHLTTNAASGALEHLRLVVFWSFRCRWNRTGQERWSPTSAAPTPDSVSKRATSGSLPSGSTRCPTRTVSSTWKPRRKLIKNGEGLGESTVLFAAHLTCSSY